MRRSLDVDVIARVHVHDLLVSLGRKLEPGLRIFSVGESHLPTLLKTDHGVTRYSHNCCYHASCICHSNLILCLHKQDKKEIEGLCLRNCKEELPAELLDKLSTSLRILILQQNVEGRCRKVPAHLQLFISQGSMPFKHIEQLTELAVLKLCEVDMDFEFVQVCTHPWMAGCCWHIKLSSAAKFLTILASFILRFTDDIPDCHCLQRKRI